MAAFRASAQPRAAAIGQVVLVLQGGGALGAYQAGVYQALHEAGIEPDWVIGTSIGAINASLIAGNEPADRMRAAAGVLAPRRARAPASRRCASMPFIGGHGANWLTMAGGHRRLLQAQPDGLRRGARAARRRGRRLLFDGAAARRRWANLSISSGSTDGATRLTVGAANVRTSEMRYFDSRDMPLDVRHVMASGALPPAFPAVRIDGELYWDGGILSNTPVEAVFDDNPRRNSLVFAVHIWNPHGRSRRRSGR